MSPWRIHSIRCPIRMVPWPWSFGQSFIPSISKRPTGRGMELVVKCSGLLWTNCVFSDIILVASNSVVGVFILQTLANAQNWGYIFSQTAYCAAFTSTPLVRIHVIVFAHVLRTSWHAHVSENFNNKLIELVFLKHFKPLDHFIDNAQKTFWKMKY